MTEHTDFTEKAYVALLLKARDKYTFNGSDIESRTPAVCWRHDIDYSPQRALAMARVEAHHGVKCVYHVLCSSRYYNILDPDSGRVIREISELGHEIGLHIDLDVFLNSALERADLLNRIKMEKTVLANLIEGEPVSISFHNHMLNIQNVMEEACIEGMLNLASPSFYGHAEYISDSNGIWRQRSLADVLNVPAYDRLHVLTHPVWWTPEILPPIERVMRAINGKARADKLVYLDTMKRDGRLFDIAASIGLSEEDLRIAGIETGTRVD